MASRASRDRIISPVVTPVDEPGAAVAAARSVGGLPAGGGAPPLGPEILPPLLPLVVVVPPGTLVVVVLGDVVVVVLDDVVVVVVGGVPPGATG